jgi:hypothetical protein
LRVSEKALEIASDVVKNIKGRAADGGMSLPFIAAMVESGPDGDHVDIGTLFGASAITAALMKKHLGHKGKVYCIDPYDDEERAKHVIPMNMPEELLSGSEEELMDNAKLFEVELTLIKEVSDPWPKKLDTAVFATAYIDGDHRAPIVWNDFENVRSRTTDYIGFDNFEEEYADVVAACMKASDTDDWFLWYKNLSFLALRRILPHRSWPELPDQMLSR